MAKRVAKVELVNTRGMVGGKRQREEPNTGAAGVEPSADELGTDGVSQRRLLRSWYLAVKNFIRDETDDIVVTAKPREQVADAEALFDITNTLVTSAKAHKNEGITPSDFVTCILRDFGVQGGANSSTSTEEGGNSVAWKDIGATVSHILRMAPGCCTMLGPMSMEPKQRKAFVRKNRVGPTESAHPDELDEAEAVEKTDTDKNMAIMFNILRKTRKARLESLVLNKISFAQTVENIFALSFLVKDGRAEISVNEKGWHVVSNAPPAKSVASGEVSYSHFVFRFDFRDWKLMLDYVGDGEEELMPHRNEETPTNDSQTVSDFQTLEVTEQVRGTRPTTPIRKFSRNRGIVLQEQTVAEDSPESDDAAAEAAAIQKGKRKLIV